MNTDQERFSGKHGELSSRIIGVFFDVYNELGSGFLESIYQEAMRLALLQAGMTVEAQVPIKVSFQRQHDRHLQGGPGGEWSSFD